MDILKALFVKCFEPFLVAFVASLHALNSAKAVALEPSSWNFAEAFKGWDRMFDDVLHGLEDKVSLYLPIYALRSRGRLFYFI